MNRSVILGLGLAILIGGSVIAQELKVSITPNPVAPGGKVRVTLQTGGATVKQPTVVVAGKRVGLSRVGDGLYTASVPVPSGTRPGAVNAVVQFVSASGRSLTIPSQVEVVRGVVQANDVRAGEGGAATAASDSGTELNIKVDQLESQVKRLQRERDALSNQVKSVSAQVDQLKSQKTTPKANLDAKQKELDGLKQELERQQQTLESQSAQLQNQLKSLANREQKVAQSESEVAAAKAQLAKQSQDVKLEVSRIRALEAELRRREADAIKSQDEAKTQAERLKAEQQQLEARQQAAQALASSIQTQTTQLDALRRQLGEKDTAVQTMAAKIESDRRSLSSAQQQIQNQQKSLAQREQSIAKMESDLKRNQSEIQVANRQLDQDRQRLKQREDEVQSKEKELENREKTLQTKSAQLDSSAERLRKIETELKSENTLLDRRRAEAVARQQEIASKEVELSRIEADLSARNTRLNQLNQRIEGDRQQLELQRTAVLDQLRAYQSLKQTVDSERSTITSKETELNRLAQSLSAQRSELATLSKQVSSDQADLARRKGAIEAGEQAFRTQQLQLQLAVNAQRQRESELDAASQVLSGQRSDLAKREAQVAETEARSLEIRKEIFDKYAALEDLKGWVQRRSAELQAAYTDASSSKEMNELIFNEQFRRLESLTQVLQNRTESLKRLNQTLIDRNLQLEIELKEIAPSQSQFVVAPYMGHRAYDGSLRLDSGAQFGLRFVGNMAREWRAEYGVGFVPTIENTRARTVIAFDLNVTRHLARLAYGDAYGVGGIVVDLANAAYLSPQVGVGIKWQVTNEFATRIDALKGRDFLFSVGVERRLILQNRDPNLFSVVPSASVPTVPPTVAPVQTGKEVELRVSLDPVRYQFVFEKPVLADADAHWAALPLATMIRYGMLSPVSANGSSVVVKPDRPVTLIEAARMVTLATALPEMVKALNSTINYSLAGAAGATYWVDVVVEDANQKVVRTLRSKVRQGIGEYQVVWDGLGDQSRRIPTGNYRVRVTVYDRDNAILSNQVGFIAVVPKTKLEFSSRAKFSFFSDLPTAYYDQIYVNEWIDMGNSASVIRSSNHNFKQGVNGFNPAQTISRLSFIIAINNAIQRQRGASYVLADLSPYRDMNQIPVPARTQIGLYISELDYGGDTQRRIRPYEPITRAEAATILQRFLTWSARYNRILLPD